MFAPSAWPGAPYWPTARFLCRQATAGWVSERAGLKELLVSQGEVVAEALARAEATEAREAAAAAFTADAVGVVKESFAQYTALAASARRPLLRQGKWRY